MLTGAISDAIVIAAEVAGFGVLVERLPWLFLPPPWVGAAFLAV